jgi:hypothetical protein
MLRLITIPRCASCRMRGPCQAPANYSDWLHDRIVFMRRECRSTRRSVGLLATLLAMALLAYLLRLWF